MDTEQQIRLNFLDEAEEYLDRMESNLIGFADTEIDAQKVDLVLRAAHSIKGGAAMMGFDILSRVAHRLEDFFKILRVRYACDRIETEVETLLLQSVDCLRNISELNRQGIKVVEGDVSQRTQPIFEGLRSYLGDLEISDENALLSQDEDMDPAILIFEEGVDGVLDRFENKLSELGIEELAQELSVTAQELIGFGHMADLSSFIELCESIQHHATVLSESAEVETLSSQALKIWRRSHALVLRGSISKLPSNLEGYESVGDNSNNPPTEEEFDPLAIDDLELSGLQSAFELETEEEQVTVIQTDMVSSVVPSSPEIEPVVEQVEKMVRVPISQLKQFNTLFEQLVLNRNSINLRLQQLQNVVTLMSQRMSQMELSNTQLKQWYDRASVEGLLSGKDLPISASVSLTSNKRDNFDNLEMDRYSDIHLICQEQIETIVQLQEVATDIELGVGEIHQSVWDLRYTTKSMQGNVTRTLMLPFKDAVKR
ncbi:MAG: Hpt domain-containing protein [Pleurocapsa sp.]